MQVEIILLLSALGAYLLGSVSTAIITCKLMGLEDPRTGGSKNPGATNVLRLGGKKAAIITLFGDMLKGLIPVLLAVQYGSHAQAPAGLAAGLAAAAAVGAFLGHLFPLYYGFAGGKGVATFYGAVLGLSWQVGLAALLIWLAMAKLSKISSLSALTSVFLTPVMLWFTSHSIEMTGAVALMALLTFWRHKTNIRNILDGSEPRIGEKK